MKQIVVAVVVVVVVAGAGPAIFYKGVQMLALDKMFYNSTVS